MGGYDDGVGDDHRGSPDGRTRRLRLLALLDRAPVGRAPSGGDAGSTPEGPQALDGAVGVTEPLGELSDLRERLDRLCAMTVSEVGVDGAGITVMGSADAGRAGHRDQLVATGGVARRLEDLQLTSGEGPCVDAYSSGVPVLAGDVSGETARWLGFGSEALAAGAAAVFSLPLQVGAVRLGTLDLHRATPGPLTDDELANALALATLATELLLEVATRAEPSEEQGTDPDAIGKQGLDAGWLPDVHAEVHVASGMVATRHRISVGAALLRIRAHAFASGEPIHDLARRIIDRDGAVPDSPDDVGAVDHATDITDDEPPAPGLSPDSSPENED